jgi:Flp pilus assembly protein TadG
MIGFIRRLFKDRRGNALIIAGATLPLIVAAAGLATDTIEWTLWKRQLQRAADSAAIAGVYDRVGSAGSTSTVANTVSHDLTLNLHTWMGLKSTYPQVTFPANAGVLTNQVQVELAVQQRLPFSSLFMNVAPTIIARSTAAAVPAGGSPCFWADEPGTAIGLNFTGNAAIEAPDCDGFSNSSGTNSSIARGSSTVTLNSVGGVGGIQNSNNFHVGSYRPYSPPLTDPFGTVNPDPTDMKCAGHYDTHGHTTTWVYDAMTESTNVATATYKDSAGVLHTGANCWTSMSIGSNTTLDLRGSYSGPIYINGGDATFQGDFACTACTVVLTNKDSSSPIGNFRANADADINMTPPTTGTYQGIAIFQDRRATDCNNCNKINGNSGSIIQGALYFPSQELEYNGSGNTTAQCTMFVARRLNFSGNSSTSNKFKKLADCGAYGLPNANTQVMVRLVA